MTIQPLDDLLDETLKLIVCLKKRDPNPSLPKKLTPLFAKLAGPLSSIDAAETEDLIWNLWHTHKSTEAEDALDEASRMLASRDYPQAETRLSMLVNTWPGFAEGWNKRATLNFLRSRDKASVRDIQQVLALEPRHFGALSGFGQICLRHGRPAHALSAFEAALAVHPHLASVKAAVDAVSAELRAKRLQ